MLDAAISNATYLWHNSSTNSYFSVNQPGEYWVTTTLNNCSSTDTINIDYFSFLQLGNDTTLCTDDIFFLDATTENSTYLWQDNSTLPTKK